MNVETRLLGSIRARKLYALGRKMPIIGSALSGLVRLALPVGRRRWVRVPRGPAKGCWLLIDPRYELGYLRGDHEPWLSDILQQWLRPGDAFVDIGAHIGYFSICAAQSVGSAGRILAFEPDPDNFSRLESNLARNHLLHVVTAVRAAVTVGKGEGVFRRATPFSARVGGSLSDDREDGLERIEVPLVALDEAIAGVTPRLVKVDVEGHEAEVLKGASRTLMKRSSCWVVELHTEESRENVAHQFEETGYHVRLLRPTHPVYLDYRQIYAVAVPV